jgi:ferredoxin-NADP reductase
LSNHEGKFAEESLEDVQSLVLCAAGTGFTPMAGLIQYTLFEKPNLERYHFCKESTITVSLPILSALSI